MQSNNPVNRDWRLISFAGEHVADEIDKGVFLVIGKLAGIEEYAEATLAGLVPDMVLLAIDHLDHFLRANRAVDIVDLVEFPAHLGVAGIDRFRAVHGLEFDVLEQIEPQALAAAAALDFDTGKFDLCHGGVTFGAFHMNLDGLVIL
jgi:hypothetical protein